MASALQPLYVEHVQWVWVMLRRLGAPPADVEDLAHEVFLTAWKALPTFDRARPMRPWLFGIAYRVVSDFRRLKRHTVEVPDDVLPDAASPQDLEKEMAQRQARALLSRAMDALEPDRRAIFVAHDLEGVPVPEIAEAIGVPLNTAYSRLRLARADLTRTLEALQRPGGAA